MEARDYNTTKGNGKISKLWEMERNNYNLEKLEYFWIPFFSKLRQIKMNFSFKKMALKVTKKVNE